MAERIADELGTELGDLVGYQVRFTDRTSKRSRVKLMTDGILLAELQRDRDLRRYDTIIIDEAHERSLNIDFLLGYLKRLLPRRPDLKLIITSATIDVDRFAAHFDAPVVEVSGRTYPVDVRYRPLVELPEADDEGEPIVRDQTEAIVDAVRELSAEGPGDILVFLPGEREIRDTADALADTPRTEIVPLYSRLSAAEQHKVFAAHTGRRVVLATNVAETSLTVPGDQVRRGHGRRADQPLLGAHQGAAAARSRRSARPRPTSAPAAAAGSGRASRSGSTPRRTSRDVRSSPTRRSCGPTWPASSCRWPRSGWATWRSSRSSSHRTGATSAPASSCWRSWARCGDGDQLDARSAGGWPGCPSTRGWRGWCSRPSAGGCVREVIVIAAALSLQDPRERPAELRPQADQQHARFKAEGSDFLTWLNLWRYVKEQQRELSSSAFRRMCKREFLN